MSNCEAGIIKPYADSQLFLPRCKCCKQHFTQLNYRQRCCQNDQCRRVRHLSQQRAYDQKKKEQSKD